MTLVDRGLTLAKAKSEQSKPTEQKPQSLNLKSSKSPPPSSEALEKSSQISQPATEGKVSRHRFSFQHLSKI